MCILLPFISLTPHTSDGEAQTAAGGGLANGAVALPGVVVEPAPRLLTKGVGLLLGLIPFLGAGLR